MLGGPRAPEGRPWAPPEGSKRPGGSSWGCTTVPSGVSREWEGELGLGLASVGWGHAAWGLWPKGRHGQRASTTPLPQFALARPLSITGTCTRNTQPHEPKSTRLASSLPCAPWPSNV